MTVMEDSALIFRKLILEGRDKEVISKYNKAKSISIMNKKMEERSGK